MKTGKILTYTSFMYEKKDISIFGTTIAILTNCATISMPKWMTKTNKGICHNFKEKYDNGIINKRSVHS